MTSLASRLWNARLTGGVVDPASSELPKSEEEAYALQHEIVALSGHACLGYKVGSTSVEAQRLLGTDEPGSGVLLAPYVHQSPARITIYQPRPGGCSQLGPHDKIFVLLPLTGGTLLYTRVTTFQADPARLSELTAKLPDIKDQVSEMDGLVDWYIVWRGDGHGLVFTVFQDNASAEASLAEVRGIWNDIMAF